MLYLQYLNGPCNTIMKPTAKHDIEPSDSGHFRELDNADQDDYAREDRMLKLKDNYLTDEFQYLLYEMTYSDTHVTQQNQFLERLNRLAREWEPGKENRLVCNLIASTVLELGKYYETAAQAEAERQAHDIK